MGWKILVLTFTALFCKVQSQICVSPGVVPQVISTPPVISAPQIIIDNSVSTALANALQLLIVSDILESKLGASCLSNFLNINPIIDTIPYYQNVDYIAPCLSPVEVISPCRPIVETVAPNFGVVEQIYPKPYGVIESYPYLGYPEIIPVCETFAPNYGCGPFGPCVTEISSPCLQDIVTPINYYGISDIIAPNFYNNPCGVEILSPCNAEVISYNPGCFGGLNEFITPIPYNSYCGDIITPCNSYGLDVISPCGPFNPGPEILTPVTPCNCGCFSNYPEITPCNNFGLTDLTPCGPFNRGIPEVFPPFYRPEILPFNPFRSCNVPEIVTPCFKNFPEVILPSSCNPGCSGCDFCGPAQFGPNFLGVNPPFAPVEVDLILPPAIPAQLNCNLGFLPSCGPVLNFNVEPLPFGPGFRY